MRRIAFVAAALLLLLAPVPEVAAQPYRCGTLITDREYKDCNVSTKPRAAPKPSARSARTERQVKQLRDSYRDRHPRLMAIFKRACDRGDVGSCHAYWSLQSRPPY